MSNISDDRGLDNRAVRQRLDGRWPPVRNRKVLGSDRFALLTFFGNDRLPLASLRRDIGMTDFGSNRCVFASGFFPEWSPLP